MENSENINILKSIKNIFILNLKLLFANSSDTKKYQLELLQECFKIEKFNKVIKIYEKIFPKDIPADTDIHLLQYVCNSYYKIKNFSKLLITTEKIINTQSIPDKDIYYFKMFRAIGYIALKLNNKYQKEINEILEDKKIEKKFKYITCITLTMSCLELKEYNEAFNMIIKAIEYYTKEAQSFAYYGILSSVFYLKHKNDLYKYSIKVRNLLQKEDELNFEQSYFIALANFSFAQRTQQNEFFKIAIKYLKKAARLSKNKKQLTVCFILLKDCFSNLEKYYQARGYTKLIIKNTNSETLKIKYLQCLSADYYYTDEYEKSLKISTELLNHPDLFEEGFVLACIAINQFELGKTQEAEANIKKAKTLSSNREDIKGMMNSSYDTIMRKK